MFGYVKIAKGDLLVKEYETYKSIYCGLCKEIGKKYSVFARFILSYDCTFYATLLLSLNNSSINFERKCCVCNPFKKCTYCKTDNSELSKAAALNVILSYYKIIDDIQDSGFFKKIFYKMVKPLFSHWRKKASKIYPEMDNTVFTMMKSQSEIEKSQNCILDLASDPTAKMLGEILKFEGKTDKEKRILYQMGYSLGRFIYFIDAVDDYKKDIEKNNFNPFKYIDFEKYETMQRNLSQAIATFYDAYNLLEIKNFKGIIDNVILKGLPTVEEEILKKVKGEL